MPNELTTKTDTLPATAPEPNALALLLRDPDRLRDFPVETVERLHVIAKEERTEGARRAFAAAMNRVQRQLLPVKKRGQNTDNHSVYALLEDVQGMADPILQEEGFSYSFSTTDCPTPDWMRIVMRLRHDGGHEELHTLDAPIDNVGPKGGPTKTKLHGVGSTFSYIERQLLCKVLGVQTYKDDDGRGGAAGPGAKPISEEQAADIDSLIAEVGADRARFLQFFKVERVADLPISRFREALRMLEAKRAR